MNRAIIVFTLTLFTVSTAQAQTMEDRLRTQLSSVLNQLHTLQDGQAALQAQKDQAVQERDQIKQQLASMQARLRSAERKPATPAPVPTKASDDSAQVAQLMQANTQLKAEKEQALHQLADATASLEVCRTKNAEAVKIGRELLAAYHDEGFGDLLGKSEPLTGIDKLQFEQLEQEYGDRLYGSQIDAVPPNGMTPHPQPSK